MNRTNRFERMLIFIRRRVSSELCIDMNRGDRGFLLRSSLLVRRWV